MKNICTVCPMRYADITALSEAEKKIRHLRRFMSESGVPDSVIARMNEVVFEIRSEIASKSYIDLDRPDIFPISQQHHTSLENIVTAHWFDASGKWVCRHVMHALESKWLPGKNIQEFAWFRGLCAENSFVVFRGTIKNGLKSSDAWEIYRL